MIEITTLACPPPGAAVCDGVLYLHRTATGRALFAEA